MSQLSARAQFMPIGGIEYKPVKPFSWDVGWEFSGNTIIIQAVPFESSVPWALRWVVSPHHKPWLLAACVHDAMLAMNHPPATAAAEWLVAARAMQKYDTKKHLVLPAFHGICLATVR